MVFRLVIRKKFFSLFISVLNAMYWYLIYCFYSKRGFVVLLLLILSLVFGVGAGCKIRSKPFELKVCFPASIYIIAILGIELCK